MEPTTDSKPNLTPTPGFDLGAATAPAAPAASVAPVTPAAPATPTMPTEQVIGAPQLDPSLFVTEPTTNSAPINPATAVTPATGISMEMPKIGATDPLTMPEQPKAPDPVEEELKAPIKAAGPVPGSIGSAISVTQDGKSETPKPTKKKMDKNTMILVGIVGGLIIVALATILIIQINN